MRAIQLTLAVCLFCSQQASADSITFNTDADNNTIAHGQIIDDEFAGPLYQLTISAENFGGPNIAVAFDSTQSSVPDPDLVAPWDGGGNLASNAFLGNLLIIQDGPSNPDPDGNGIIDSTPNDEASNHPAGRITFDFSDGGPLDSFGLTIVDIEQSELNGYSLEFYNGASQVGGTVNLFKFTDNTSGNPFYDNTVVFAGDNSANILQPVTLAKLATEFGGWDEVTPFNKVVVNFGGSGALGEINFTRAAAAVPEPTSLALLATGALSCMGYRWRRKSKLAA